MIILEPLNLILNPSTINNLAYIIKSFFNYLNGLSYKEIKMKKVTKILVTKCNVGIIKKTRRF